jgi:hypothetical protein
LIELLIHTFYAYFEKESIKINNSYSFVIYPLTALLAAIAGDDKYISALTLPILPLKFLFVVAKHTSPSAKTPW